MELLTKPSRSGKYSFNITNDDLNKVVSVINDLEQKINKLQEQIDTLLKAKEERVEVLPEKTKKTKKQ